METIPVSLRQIAYLLAVAEEGSTAAAARRMNVSQPSVSLAVAKFEAGLGQPMFVRLPGQGMAPTAVGARKLGEMRALLRHARAVLAPAGEDAEGGELVLGVLSTLGPRYAPQLVSRFRARHPSARVRIVEGHLDDLSAGLRSGRIELALVYDFALPSDLAILPLADVRPYGLVWPGHRLERAGAVRLADLLEDPLVLMGLPQSRDYFLSLIQSQGARAKIAFETGSLEMLRSAVANRMGVGLLATDLPYDLTYDGGRIVRVPLAGALPPHRVALARNPSIPQGPVARAFEAQARAVIAGQ